MAKIVTVDIDFEKDALSDDFKEFITALLNFLFGIIKIQILISKN